MKANICLCVSLFLETGSYVCEFCGKQYKYFNPYQEHVALHTPMGELVELFPNLVIPLLVMLCVKLLIYVMDEVLMS